VSARQFDNFKASSLFCQKCGSAQPVDERLLLVLPDREIHEYTCATCGDAVGTREVTGADAVARKFAARRAGPQVRIL
jgi:hypothetical protein